MKYDILIVGVGGQGVLTLSYILDNAAMSKGYHFKQSEVHGMAQRGGSVYSHMRISDRVIFSDIIPEGSAEMLLSLEPLEVMRYIQVLHPEGVVVTSSVPFKNIPNYPDEAELLNTLFKLRKIVLINSRYIAAKAQMTRAENIVLLGAATPFLPFKLEELSRHVKKVFEGKDQIIEGNILAMRMGYNTGSFYKALLDSDVPPGVAFKLVSKLDPTTIDPGKANGFARVLLSRGKECESKLDALPLDSPTDPKILD